MASEDVEFVMPEDPEQLWAGDSDLPLRVKDLVDFSDSPEAAGEAAEGVAFTLCDQNPLCIVEQSTLDQLVSVVRCFDLLGGSKRRQLVDALCSSLTCLNAWIDKLLGSPPESQDRDVLLQYRSAFKAYLFFLHWVASVAAREGRDAAGAAQPAASATSSKGRGRKKAAEDDAWDWPTQFGKVMHAVGASLNTDLWALFSPNRPDEAMLLKLVQLASAALETPAASRDEELAGGAAHVLASCALRYGQLESVSSALVDALNNREHTPPLVAELLRYSVSHWDDARLAGAVLAEVAAVDPSEYERQQNATGERAGVRSVAAFVEEMASRLPRLMANQMALLLPHLGGKAWTLRSGIVTAIGFVLHKAFDTTAADGSDAQGALSRLRSKQHLLDVLCERVRDQSSYVRKAVLQTWQYLAAARAIPLGHWQVVTDVATGRLEDKSSVVRKEALRLLQSLMLHNPFGPALPVDRFAASLATHRAMLDLVLPPSQDQMQELTIASAEPAQTQPQEGDQPENMEVQEAAEEATGAEEAPIDGAAAAEAAAEDAPAAAPGGRSCAEVGWDGSVEELQALVASLELAVGFAESLTGCMPTLVQLLASSTVSDVQEAVAMLLTCKQFDVAGAPEAIRKMLPLVFARDQAVKDRIVEALDQLYITGWAGNTFTSAQAARNLVALASGANLGELGAMEEVVKEFMGKGFLTPVMLHELWDVAAKAHEAVAAGAAGGARALRDLRAALAVLAMATATRPEAFGEPHVRMLLRFGFDGGQCADALITRHACATLQNLAANFATGAYDALHGELYASLTRTVVASPLPEANWYSAAEAAIGAIYTLHPAPEQLCVAILRHTASAAFQGADNTAGGDTDMLGGADADQLCAAGADAPSVSALSRFFFVMGHVALQQLVHVERCVKHVRRSRHEAEKQSAEDQAERARGGAASDAEDEDINAELGVGSVAADAELDAMKDAAEAQILSPGSLLAPYARLVSAICHHRSLLGSAPALRGSALLALCKLMAVDPAYCDANLQLLFTLLQSRAVEPGLRSNLVIALGDLALRFPNQLEPWTEHIYRPLADPDVAVRKNTMMVLSHLILNDMMKVKGHIAKMAVCLEDSDQRVAALAQLFFHELSKKEYKGTSPIYNLLPDMLSNLSRDPRLGRPQFQSVMQLLLGYIKKDRQGDALVEKLCQRLAATEDPSQWRNVAFCLAQLPVSDKGVRKLAECFKLYQRALADGEVADCIAGILAKAKKGAAKADVKALVEELEAKIVAAAGERAEEDATAQAAAQRAARDRGEAPADDTVEGAGEDEGMLLEDGPPAEAGGHGENAAAASVVGRALEGVPSDAASHWAAVKAEAGVEGGGEADAASGVEGDQVGSLSGQSAAAAAEGAGQAEEEGEEESVAVRPRQSGSRRSAAVPAERSTRASGRRPTPAVTDQEEEEGDSGSAATEVAAAEAPRPRRRGSKTAAVEAPAVPAAKGRLGSRRSKALVDCDSDDGDSESRIAAVQAGVSNLKMEGQ